MAFGQLDRGNTPQPLHEINVTPLVDVMLVLLVVFIVTAPLLTHKIKLDLPKAQATPAQVVKPVVISLTGEARLYLDSVAVTETELAARLREMTAQGASPSVQLRADGALPYRHVARVMALVQSAGVTKLAFVTDPRDTP